MTAYRDRRRLDACNVTSLSAYIHDKVNLNHLLPANVGSAGSGSRVGRRARRRVVDGLGATLRAGHRHPEPVLRRHREVHREAATCGGRGARVRKAETRAGGQEGGGGGRHAGAAHAPTPRARLRGRAAEVQAVLQPAGAPAGPHPRPQRARAGALPVHAAGAHRGRGAGRGGRPPAGARGAAAADARRAQPAGQLRHQQGDRAVALAGRRLAHPQVGLIRRGFFFARFKTILSLFYR